MQFWHTIVLGIIEGFTEFLPVSSTGHLLVAGHLLAIDHGEFFKTFIIVIQLGAMLGAVLLYAKKVFTSRSLFTKVILAFIPTSIIGFLLYKVIKNILFGNIHTIAWALLLGGVAILFFEKLFEVDKKQKEEIEKIDLNSISYKQSFWIGVAQAVAVVPGVSRSGATILGGLAMKIPRKAIVEFSFILAIPTITAASLYDLIKTPVVWDSHEYRLLATGFILSFIFALIFMKWLLRYIEKNSFKIFGFYRIAIGLAILILI